MYDVWIGCNRPEWKHKYGFVVVEDGDIIPTAAWEGVREGIDDMRYLRTLEAAAGNAVDADASAVRAAGKAGLALVDRIRAAIDTNHGLEEKTYGRQWQAFGDMAGDREKLIGAILAIQRAERV
jgi:hypothetical protein